MEAVEQHRIVAHLRYGASQSANAEPCAR
jgi:hypothetical protein